MRGARHGAVEGGREGEGGEEDRRGREGGGWEGERERKRGRRGVGWDEVKERVRERKEKGEGPSLRGNEEEWVEQVEGSG